MQNGQSPAAVKPSISFRPPVRPRGHDAIAVRGRSGFGHGSPKWTIPSSRREETPLIPLPGPGAYNPSLNLDRYRRVGPGFPKAIPRNDNVSATANVEFIVQSMFPRSREFHIGVRENTILGDEIDTPGPNYFPNERPSRFSHKILSRPMRPRTVSETGHLGPGSYDPQPTLAREPAFSFGGSGRLKGKVVDRPGTPGPGRYDPTVKETVPRDPIWTIGRKSRARRQNRFEEASHRPELIMIDQISIDLALVPKNGLVKQYLMHHPELRLLVHELFTIVLDEKPDDPVVFIVELFRRMQLELESVSARSSSPVG